ncbi:MAG: RsmB/NOP family class I SAM-dependent RNA methyltransferase [Proteobacteria bacterium]|nr:RsmB/NOP family class I SAM-dependent RNA methyltransferase [Pseudomonadota bacterium]
MDVTQRYLRQIDNLNNVFQAVHSVFQQKRPIDNFLTVFFRKNHRFGSKDRKFLSNAIFGYYRWYGWLKQIDPKKRDLALLLGYLLDGNEIDDLISFWGKRCGVDPDRFLPGNGTTAAKSRAVSPEVPQPDVSRLNPDFAPEWPINVIESFQTRPNLWIRLADSENRTFLDFLKSKKADYRFHGRSRNSLEIMSPVNLYESLDFRKGKLEIQDIASQGVGLICRAQPGETWWDVCAGSGGKALHLSSMMRGTGTVFATDVDRSRFSELKRRIKRDRLSRNIKPQLWNKEGIPEFAKRIDGVLVDAPCSCSGTWRRAPDLRWSFSRERISYFSSLQQELLSRVAKRVSEGSVLIYATCSIFPEENERVVESFLKKHPSFLLQKTANPFTGEVSENGTRFLPPAVDGNGMYVARMIRR